MSRAALILVLLAALALAALAIVAPAAAADGWRAAFLLLSAAPIGAVVLLLVAGVTGADWDAALRPLLPAMPRTALLAVPVVIGQALFHQPAGHLHLWLSPPAYLARTALALLFWSWTARRLEQGRVTQFGPLLLVHGVVVSVIGYDWLLGVAPAQPNSAAPMILATMQIGAAAALACAVGFGRAGQRRDLAYLLLAAGLGLAYLLYVDFVIVWFGNLPRNVGWYAQRFDAPAVLLPGLALLAGLIAPMLLVGLGRSDPARGLAGWLALAALGLVCVWMAAGPVGWLGLLAALATVAGVGAVARELRA